MASPFWADGRIVAFTNVTWDRVYGKADRRTYGRTNTYFTAEELKRWGYRNGVEIDPDDLELLKLEEMI